MLSGGAEPLRDILHRGELSPSHNLSIENLQEWNTTRRQPLRGAVASVALRITLLACDCRHRVVCCRLSRNQSSSSSSKSVSSYARNLERTFWFASISTKPEFTNSRLARLKQSRRDFAFSDWDTNDPSLHTLAH